jgi:adenylosuccinate synthase
MPNRVIVGAQWGDEGKAKVVDYLTRDADVIVRFQGGANAGHTVLVGDQEFIFHLIPSGIMHADKQCVISNGVVLDPAQLLQEISEIKEKGFDPEGRLRISENAHVVLPHHKVLDKLREQAAGGNAIGTTGRGIGPCYSDKINRQGIRVSDLLDPEQLRDRLQATLEKANAEITKVHGGQALELEPILAEFLDWGNKIRAYVCDTSAWLHTQCKQGKSLIFEGAQGTILDVDHGTYPFVTSSNTTAGGAITGSGIGPQWMHQVIGVVKGYTTRVGNGPFPTELDDAIGEAIGRIGHEFGATTGRKRRCGWFDAPVVRRAAQVNGLTHLAITKIDVLDSFDEVKICVAYDIEGERHELIPNRLDLVKKAKPIYESMPGWKTDLTACTKWSDLPENAQNYVKRLAELLDVKIGLVSVGPRRDQSIEVDLH